MAVLGTFTSGSVLTAAELNAIATWTSFTPSWTGITAGTGASNTGQYCELNDILFIRAKYVLGTSGSFTNPVMTLPASRVASGSPTFQWTQTMQSVMVDSGVNTYALAVLLNSTTTIGVYAQTASGTYLTYTSPVSATLPFTSGVNDYIEIAGYIQVN